MVHSIAGSEVLSAKVTVTDEGHLQGLFRSKMFRFYFYIVRNFGD